MIIDSHLHLTRKENFDEETLNKLKLKVPQNTQIEDLVGWLKGAGVVKAVVMGQDMTRIWKSTFGDEYVRKVLKQYPDFFLD